MGAVSELKGTMRSNVRNLALTLLIPIALGCGPGTSEEAPPAPPPAAPAAARPAPAARPAEDGRPLVVFLGDSLTAGLGLDESQAYPALVARALQEQDRPIRLLDWLLNQKPDILVVGLGANDALRGQSAAQIEKNLREIVRRSQEAGARVLLLGMQIPPNYGGDYARDYAALYPRIAKEMNVELVPFLLEGVGGIPELNLDDGIHPNAEGQEKVAENVVPHLMELLEEEKAASE
jgi:acyl-CoA thioesterase-1